MEITADPVSDFAVVVGTSDEDRVRKRDVCRSDRMRIRRGGGSFIDVASRSRKTKHSARPVRRSYPPFQSNAHLYTPTTAPTGRDDIDCLVAHSQRRIQLGTYDDISSFSIRTPLADFSYQLFPHGKEGAFLHLHWAVNELWILHQIKILQILELEQCHGKKGSCDSLSLSSSCPEQCPTRGL
jgi:hypothetical protein